MTRTLQNKKLRALLYYAQDGLCAMCGKPLPDDWHADHVVPYSVTGRTNIHEMQALCPGCNLKKGVTMLRKHQREMQQVAAGIADKTIRATNILVHVTPGGGKSALPMILAKELAEGLNYRVCWVVPRDALRRQGEQNFKQKFYRNLIGHKSEIIAANNEINPTKGMGGYVTTYQAIAANPQLHFHEFRRHPYILFLDECHHVPHKGGDSEEAKYYSAIAPLVELAKCRIFASGTLERHDGERIAFLPYKHYVNAESVDKAPQDEWRFITYSRKDALEEGAVVPLHFDIANGRARWFDPTTGQERTVDSIAETSRKDQAAVLHTILSTEYAHSLLDKCLEHWQNHKTNGYKKAKMLVIAPGIRAAKDYLAHIRQSHYDADIATSDETHDHKTNIARFKSTRRSQRTIDILVTVGMAYEGLDVPEITHVACLTHIRSRPWIEQCICRANRTDANKTHGYVFVPDDPKMTAIIKAIDEEQQAVVVTHPPKPRERTPGDNIELIRPEPIASDVTESRGLGMEDGTEVGYDEARSIENAMDQLGIKGISIVQAKQFMAMMGAGVVPNSDEPVNYNEPVLTPSERVKKYRQSIHRTINRAAKGNPERIREIQVERHSRFGSVSEASVDTLQLMLRWLDETYGGATS